MSPIDALELIAEAFERLASRFDDESESCFDMKQHAGQLIVEAWNHGALRQIDSLKELVDFHTGTEEPLQPGEGGKLAKCPSNLFIELVGFNSVMFRYEGPCESGHSFSIVEFPKPGPIQSALAVFPPRTQQPLNEQYSTACKVLAKLCRSSAAESPVQPAGDELAVALDENKRVLTWGTVRYERLTDAMIKALEPFVDAYNADNLAVKLADVGLRYDGGFLSQAFKQNRTGEPKVHPVSAIFEKVGAGEYRIKPPLE